MNEGNLEIKKEDAVEKTASIEYLCVQPINILDNEAKIVKYSRSIERLQEMGIKVILATG